MGGVPDVCHGSGVHDNETLSSEDWFRDRGISIRRSGCGEWSGVEWENGGSEAEAHGVGR